MKIEIEKNALQAMHNHAEIDYPHECCGFFYGSAGKTRTVKKVKKIENAQKENREKRFQIDPRDYQKAEKYAVEHNLDLLGVYHSHPDHPAEPSEYDRKAAQPYFSYIIISVQEGKAVSTRSWRLNEERQFDEEPVKAIELTTKK